jgi:hypothetical protein
VILDDDHVEPVRELLRAQPGDVAGEGVECEDEEGRAAIENLVILRFRNR